MNLDNEPVLKVFFAFSQYIIQWSGMMITTLWDSNSNSYKQHGWFMMLQLISSILQLKDQNLGKEKSKTLTPGDLKVDDIRFIHRHIYIYDPTVYICDERRDPKRRTVSGAWPICKNRICCHKYYFTINICFYYLNRIVNISIYNLFVVSIQIV